jgi:hypothetical protein
VNDARVARCAGEALRLLRALQHQGGDDDDDGGGDGDDHDDNDDDGYD